MKQCVNMCALHKITSCAVCFSTQKAYRRKPRANNREGFLRARPIFPHSFDPCKMKVKKPSTAKYEKSNDASLYLIRVNAFYNNRVRKKHVCAYLTRTRLTKLQEFENGNFAVTCRTSKFYFVENLKVHTTCNTTLLHKIWHK